MTTTDKLCALLRERHAKGLEKYGVTVDRDDLTIEQWIQHALEESLDHCQYLMRLKDTIEDLRAEIDELKYNNKDLSEKLTNTEEALREAVNKGNGGVVW